MTVTQLHPQTEIIPVVVVDVPRELPPLATHTTINLHVNADTRIVASHLNDSRVVLEFVDGVTGYNGVTVFISDADVIRLVDALQSSYTSKS